MCKYPPIYYHINNDKEKDKIIEFPLRNINFIIKNNMKGYVDAYCEYKNIDLNENEVDNRISYMSLKIKNVGAGSIVNMKVALRKVDGDCNIGFFTDYRIPENENMQDIYLVRDFNGNKVYQNLILCSKDEIIIRMIVEKDSKKLIKGKYELYFIYDDISNNHYKQNFIIEITESKIVSIT